MSRAKKTGHFNLLTTLFCLLSYEDHFSRPRPRVFVLTSTARLRGRLIDFGSGLAHPGPPTSRPKSLHEAPGSPRCALAGSSGLEERSSVTELIKAMRRNWSRSRSLSQEL